MLTIAHISAPLLAWPSPSRYRYRYTETSPTLSAIHGLLSAAAGVRRGESRPDWVTGTSMAIRLDRQGSVLRDFHTINPADKQRYRALSEKDKKRVRVVVTADGVENRTPVVTERFYRQDQTVMLFLEDNNSKLLEVLSSPRFALFAGRKACPLSFPFVLGQAELGLEEALSIVPSAGPIGKLDATLFTNPKELVAVRRRSAPERPTGPVAESYALQERYGVLVDPPRVSSVFEVINYLRGDENVAK